MRAQRFDHDARPRARRLVRRAAAAVAVVACTLHANTASADVSSWLSLGGGYGAQHDDGAKRWDGAAAATFAVGIGSDPTRSLVVGGLIRSTTYLSLGTDLGFALRFASGGFARGEWGLAVEAGPKWRTFGAGEHGRWPLSAMLIGGAPWGLQLGVGGDFARVAGNDAPARGLFAVLEIDLLRLTVMRRGATEQYWPNPSPAGAPPARPSGPLAGLLW